MRVLLIEDEVRLASLIAEGLGDEGVDVDIEHDGDSGYWRATEGSYDAIVCDIMLPGRNGYEVCRDVRAAEVWTPILMLTAKDGEFDEAEALDIGADDFLRKPFSYVVLLARLRALVRRGTPPRPAVIECGPVVFDPAIGEVRCRGAILDLTRRERRVLEVLMRSGGDVVSRQQIIDKVWGMDDEPMSNIVDVYVRYLRKKLDEAGAADLIRTVRGLGYRMVAP
ncbi:MAG: response regulator transcription factor [Actinomycetia bacterium]|nr:response regulator transcription factor [Actinomycetes bacterium]MCP4961364.1 response regulator transcription factor [Actinomycetes bacterium]